MLKCWRPFPGVRAGCGWPRKIPRWGRRRPKFITPPAHSTRFNPYTNSDSRPSPTPTPAPRDINLRLQIYILTPEKGPLNANGQRQRSLTLWSLENQSSTINNRSAAGTSCDIENRAPRWAAKLQDCDSYTLNYIHTLAPRKWNGFKYGGKPNKTEIALEISKQPQTERSTRWEKGLSFDIVWEISNFFSFTL